MERNKALDILRFFAVLLIVNSHFDELYPYWKELATGGAIGDALFFFCSGYALFLGRLGRFDVWYKRRVRRIYPSVISLAFITIFMLGHDVPFLFAMFYNAGWFVACIMIYYIFLYFVRRYVMDRMKWVYAIVITFVLCWYALFFEPLRTAVDNLGTGLNWLVFCRPMDRVWMYQWNYFKWGFFFLFMLMGADVGLRESQRRTSHPSVWTELVVLLVCVCAFYGIPVLLQGYPAYSGLLILTLLPLCGICMSFYRLCSTQQMLKILQMKYIGSVVSIIGGLCLEIYLVQSLLRTTSLNYLFPLNLLIVFIAIVGVAYLCRSLGRFIQQTFSSEDGYRWKEIFRL